MANDFDEFILLLLRTSGMRDAVLAYEEETLASHAEATTAVKNLARQSGLDRRTFAIGKLGAAIVVGLTLGALSCVVMIGTI